MFVEYGLDLVPANSDNSDLPLTDVQQLLVVPVGNWLSLLVRYGPEGLAAGGIEHRPFLLFTLEVLQGPGEDSLSRW